ncbi:MAG: glycosyltransferase [Chloroflexi bacterium]|nr:glycosyltransferase [Chloroflexota bacterium]
MNWRAIHQLLPFFSRGDAIGNLALATREVLRAWGFQSEIFAELWEPVLAKECRPLEVYRSRPDNLLILHYSVGGQSNRFVLNVPDRVVVWYHNITPPRFFYAVNGDLARRLQDARRDLALLANKATAMADSAFNQDELTQIGFRVLGVVPPILSFDHLRASDTMREARAASNWLCVGRIAPNKCIHDIIKAFYFYHARIQPDSRLWLVGSDEGMAEYARALTRLVARLSLDDAVVFAGRVDRVGDYFRNADIYISMSEHEGFCIPLVEAMHCDIPILAYASTGVPDTLGGVGVLIREKNYSMIAELAHQIISDTSLRARLIARQRERLAAFAPEIVRAHLRACLERAYQKDTVNRFGIRSNGEINGSRNF